CLDYDRIHRWLVETWPARPHTELLEQLAEELLAKCFEDPRVEWCRVRIRKPEAHGGRGAPEILATRWRIAPG
ncbi:MAG: dihydroneopterin aldolase, partial [Geminicoccaceae bacterium]|nr:dihydroneopterin aldolase [Geminicoccaceae bacterium]